MPQQQLLPHRAECTDSDIRHQISDIRYQTFMKSRIRSEVKFGAGAVF